MRHLFTSRVRVVMIAAVIIAALLAVVSSLTGLNLPDLAVKGILTPIRTGASKLTQQAERLYSYMFEFESLETENKMLKEQLAAIEEDSRNADAISRENERLRALLELKEANPDYTLLDGYVITRSSHDWSSTLTINRGSAAGIEEGMCAITANG